jgi:hypothetical protein
MNSKLENERKKLMKLMKKNIDKETLNNFTKVELFNQQKELNINIIKSKVK